jgi:hypothetical protein
MDAKSLGNLALTHPPPSSDAAGHVFVLSPCPVGKFLAGEDPSSYLPCAP